MTLALATCRHAASLDDADYLDAVERNHVFGRRVVLFFVVHDILLAFVISLDDVVITEFVKSAGQDTLPTYMLGQLRRAISPEVNAISTALLVLTVVLLTAFFMLSRKRKDDGE